MEIRETGTLGGNNSNPFQSRIEAKKSDPSNESADAAYYGPHDAPPLSTPEEPES
jgi:hypothetical protein